jgi:hypothetical protein
LHCSVGPSFVHGWLGENRVAATSFRGVRRGRREESCRHVISRSPGLWGDEKKVAATSFRGVPVCGTTRNLEVARLLRVSRSPRAISWSIRTGVEIDMRSVILGPIFPLAKIVFFRKIIFRHIGLVNQPTKQNDHMSLYLLHLQTPPPSLCLALRKPQLFESFLFRRKSCAAL